MSYDIEFYEDNAKTPGENDYVFAEYNLSGNYGRFLQQYGCYPGDASVVAPANYAFNCAELLEAMCSHERFVSAAAIDKDWRRLVNCENEWNTPLCVVRYLRWVCETYDRFPNKKMRCIG